MSERAPRSQVVSEEIRAMILSGRLKPGERLVEESLSAELGVSRVPVREALLALSAQGLVRIEPRRGATVAEITPKIVAELVEVRALLEGLNARLAAQRHDPEIVAQLEDTLAVYHAWHATRADLLRRMDRTHESRSAYDKAIELAGNSAQSAYLRRRRAALE